MPEISKEDLTKLIGKAVEDKLREASQSNQPTETASQHVAHCPDCYSDVLGRLNKTSEVKCADCGLPLGSKEMASQLKNCPNCGCEDCEEIEHEEE